ncbi:DUF4230 domain-containing protein [Tellurirhabdus rosea]|uniref:DUF4230 domain-containing protein n=1 Tax=Tellurirhabdus rosea TaxID=2674997 RepID=UPI00225B3335|nr:DUF4230 domain-containing protein [Tellurirhabdus rosea]
MESSDLVVLFFTLLLGGAGGMAVSSWLKSRKSGTVTDVRIDSTMLVERIEKVFKVVMAEGYFSEILTYQDQKKYLYFLNDEKRALIIAKAKVLVGYDFAKMRFRQPADGDKRLIIEYFPEPEVLSIDTDYKFYDLDPGLLNHFKSEDYTRLLDEAKKTMYDRALQSDLPRIASNQIQYMIFQLADSLGWQLELPPAEQRKLDEIAHRYDDLKADPRELPGDILDDIKKETNE